MNGVSSHNAATFSVAAHIQKGHLIAKTSKSVISTLSVISNGTMSTEQWPHLGAQGNNYLPEFENTLYKCPKTYFLKS